MTEIYKHLYRENVKRVAQAVARGDGWTVSNAKNGFFKAVEEMFSPPPSVLEEIEKEFGAILKTKWHIDIFEIDGEEEFTLFVLDSYGESHIERLKKKAAELIDENRDDSEEEEDFHPFIATPDKVRSVLQRIFE